MPILYLSAILLSSPVSYRHPSLDGPYVILLPSKKIGDALNSSALATCQAVSDIILLQNGINKSSM